MGILFLVLEFLNIDLGLLNSLLRQKDSTLDLHRIKYQNYLT